MKFVFCPSCRQELAKTYFYVKDGEELFSVHHHNFFEYKCFNESCKWGNVR